ncbi:MAG: hypothetical protein LH477_02150 [Nocardioides sp.]|nr:hypothetical protein [Nocardioides sp.]
MRGHQALSQADGYPWARLLRQAETPSTCLLLACLLLVGWDTLESPTVAFRYSELFGPWRGAVGRFGRFFDGAPSVVHSRADPVGGDTVPSTSETHRGRRVGGR